MLNNWNNTTSPPPPPPTTPPNPYSPTTPLYPNPPRSHPQPPHPVSPPPWTLAGSLDPSTGIFYRTPENPRLRTAQACEKCRTRKAKCSGEHPTCNRCLTRGLICEYAKEGRMRGPHRPKPKEPIGTTNDDDNDNNPLNKSSAGHKRFASAPNKHPSESSSDALDSDFGKRRSLPLSFPSLSPHAHPSSHGVPLPRRDNAPGRARPPSLILQNSHHHHHPQFQHPHHSHVVPSNVPHHPHPHHHPHHHHQQQQQQQHHIVKQIPGLNAPIKYQQDELLPVNKLQHQQQHFRTYPEHPLLQPQTYHHMPTIPHGGSLALASHQASDGHSYKEDPAAIYYPYPAGYVDLMQSMYSKAAGVMQNPHSDTSRSHDSSPTNATHSSPTTPISQSTFYHHEKDEELLAYPSEPAPYLPAASSSSSSSAGPWGNLVGSGEFVRPDENDDRVLVDSNYPHQAY